MGYLERTGVTSAHSSEGRWIVLVGPGRLGRVLTRREQARCDGETFPLTYCPLTQSTVELISPSSIIMLSESAWISSARQR